MSDFGVVLFHTTSAAIRGEKLARAAGWDVKLIPTPRQLSSDCGIALKFEWTKEKEMRRLLKDVTLEYAGIYEL